MADFVAFRDLPPAVAACLASSAVAEPSAPDDYAEGYKAPVHSDKPLNVKNAHARDARIVFYEVPHIYTVDGRCTGASVSKLIKPYTREFDAVATISAMKAGRQAWPRLEYTVGARRLAADEQWAACAHIAITDRHGKTVVAGAPRAASAARPLGLMQGESAFAYERAMEDGEIVRAWSSPEARNRGTEAHYMIELFMNGLPSRTSDAEVAYAIEFTRSQLMPRGMRAFRTEWEIFAEEEDLSGSVDFVAQLPDGRLVIVDWKRSKKLSTKFAAFRGERMAHPFGHLDDCDAAVYCVQLSAYAWILEKYYGYRVAALALCSVHPDDAFHAWMPYLGTEVEFLMRRRREVHAAYLTLDAVDTRLPRCALTGRVAHDARRMADGRICGARDLYVHAHRAGGGGPARDEGVDAPDVRAECERALREVRTPRSREEEALVDARAWKHVVSGHRACAAYREMRAF